MSAFLKETYKGKTVLVTGDTGFKGSWLCIWLLELGARVIGYGLKPYTENDNFVRSGLREKIIHIDGDVRDIDLLDKTFRMYKPHFVFHMAAQPLVRLSYSIPRETYETNIMGTFNVLECIRSLRGKCSGVLITTDKCYKNKEQIWGYRETDELGGFDPYSSSKACAEILTESYRNSFFNIERFNKHYKSIVTVRAGNVIGGGDWQKDRIVPDCVRALRGNGIIHVRNPQAVRPFQHVLEPLYGYLLLCGKLDEDVSKYSGAWNFGPNNDSVINVKKLVQSMIKNWGSGEWEDISSGENNGFHETNLLLLDSTKAMKVLGWKGKFSIDQCINKTVEWYKNFEIHDPYKLCVRQIEGYLN